MFFFQIVLSIVSDILYEERELSVSFYCPPSTLIPLTPGFILTTFVLRTGRDSINVPMEESAFCHSKTKLKFYR